PQFEIIAGDFGGDADQGVEPVGFNRRELGVGGLDGTADASEEVEFPDRIEASVVDFYFTRRARCAGWRRRFAEKAVRIARIGLDSGCEVEGRESSECAGFFEIRGRNTQVMIVREGALYQAVESCV